MILWGMFTSLKVLNWVSTSIFTILLILPLEQYLNFKHVSVKCPPITVLSLFLSSAIRFYLLINSKTFLLTAVDFCYCKVCLFEVLTESSPEFIKQRFFWCGIMIISFSSLHENEWYFMIFRFPVRNNTGQKFCKDAHTWCVSVEVSNSNLTFTRRAISSYRSQS